LLDMRNFASRFAPLALAAALHGVLLAGALPARAQGPADPISIANQQYEDEKYDESAQTLTGALVRPGNTREQEIQIYTLLFRDFIVLGRPKDAENTAIRILQRDPTFDFGPNESPRFRDALAAARKKWEDAGKPGIVQANQPALAPVTLQHVSPSQVPPGTQISLLTRPNDPQHRVASVHLFYRSSGEKVYEEEVANLDTSGAARASIPPAVVKPPFVEYYFIAFGADSQPLAERGDPTAPLRVAVPEPSKGWVLPVAIGGGILGAAAIVGGLALAGVFKGSSSAGGPRQSTVSINIGQ
jgi:hypothetical protein